MLKIIFLAFALETQSAQPVPQFPDWRSEFTINPLSSQRTIQWSCEPGSPQSSAKLRVDDVGGKYRNSEFRMTLLELSSPGMGRTKEIAKKVQESLDSIDHLMFFEGKCRGKTRAIWIKGTFGKGYQEKSFTIDLQ